MRTSACRGDQHVEERRERKAAVRHEEQRGADEDGTDFHQPRRAIVGGDTGDDERRQDQQPQNREHAEVDHSSLRTSWPTKKPPRTEPSANRTSMVPTPWFALASTAITTPPVRNVVLKGSPTWKG